MDKMAGILIRYVLLAGMIAFILAGCGAKALTTTPTTMLPYIHYTPSARFNIHLEFDYPSSWVFNEEKIQDTDIIVVGLGDPRLLTVPTRAPNEPHGTPSDFGRISIWIQPVNSNQTLETVVESYKQGGSDKSWITKLNDYKIKLDGYDASVLEYQIEPIFDNGYTSVMFERDTFFAVQDQIYQITFTVAEKERGGEFEKGYDYFFNSLKIVP
ncbi:MAG TPA: hypothetical protein VK206_05435 [Anaerolineales bacterium]|nr:hypothetical protein [Anaerolineales bacterium]